MPPDRVDELFLRFLCGFQPVFLLLAATYFSDSATRLGMKTSVIVKAVTSKPPQSEPDFGPTNSSANESDLLPTNLCLGVDMTYHLSLNPKGDFNLHPELGTLRQGLCDHPCRVMDRRFARFVVQMGLHNAFDDRLDMLLNLPSRTPYRPYIIFWSDHQTLPKAKQLMARSDVIFFAFDLRDNNLHNNDGRPLPGVTIAPPHFPPQGVAPRDPQQISATPEWFFTFQGSPNQVETTVRFDADKAFYNLTHDVVVNGTIVSRRSRPDVFFCLFGDRCNNTERQDYWKLFNSSYTLIPRGHGRWSYRFSEAIGMCSIPVIMSDGWTLPYEQLIDYSMAAVVLPERLAKNAQALLDRLPTDRAEILERRRYICEISRLYFAGPDERVFGLLKSADVFLSRHLRKVGGVFVPDWIMNVSGKM